MKTTQNLNSGWTLKTQKYGSLPCSVPCSLYSVLLDCKKIENPYYRENEYISTSICDDDCDFETAFECPHELLDKEKIVLTFEGVDTIADICLNGKKLGSADNMHCIWRYNVKGILAEKNTLSVHIYSPNKWISEKQKNRRLWGVSSTMDGYTHMRKAHCMFGWDWGPMLPDMGIWRSVSLTAYDTAIISDVYLTQKHENGKVTVHSSVSADGDFDYAQMQIYAPDGNTVSVQTDACGSKAELFTEISDPQLWWANGYGSQPLYTVKTTIFAGGEAIDERAEKIGLRTLSVSREKDEWGEEFAFILNGKKLFAMGANYIPEDQIVVNCNEERTRKFLKHCAKANYNCIRVWGGGYYPDEYFYDECDRLGLIVWQDFMFACSSYLLTDEFEKAIRHEIKDNVIRLRNHASLGLWCGNNEIESAWEGWGLPDDPEAKADYLTIFEKIIPETLSVYGGETFYWPSSPSSGGGFDRSSSNHAGDMHYWDIWHNLKPIEAFRKLHYRFCSEYGFESVPSIKTMLTVADREKGDLDLMSPVMEAHQKCEQGNEKLMYYLAQMVRYPYSFERLIYSSQILQADCIRSSVEHMRRARGRCMGSLYWQVNDSNPVISWSSIDYYGRWKALHYYAKRFYAPVLLSLDDGMTEDGAQVGKNLRLAVSNERLTAFSGEVRYALRNNKSEILCSESFDAAAEPLSSVFVRSMDMSGYFTARESKRELYLEYSLWENGKKISSGTTLFVRPKQFTFLKPDIEVTAEDCGDRYVISLTCDNYAKSVCLDFADRDAVFEDNWFDIHGAEGVSVTLYKSELSEDFADTNELLEILTVETNYEG